MNIIDIARLAGVSKSTVSRYLNDGYVSEESRKKIQEVIDKTGFVPSTYGKTLRTKKTNLIGVILPKISSETISKIVGGISEEISNDDYNIILGNTDLNIEKEIEYLNIFRNKNVDGVIFVATIITERHLEIIKQMKVPIVIVGQNIEGYPCVYHSDYEAAYEMTNYLIENNHKKIAYIGTNDEDISTGINRKNGFINCLKDNSIICDKSLIKNANFSQQYGYEMTRELLKINKDIDAIFCATYTMSLGVLSYLREHNIEVPDEISLCAIGDSKFSNLITPSITTVQYFYKESGIKSTKMLLDILSGRCKKENLESIKLGYNFLKRDSVRHK
ncbi:LacI family DNA-binding transcriptional regulator [Romboutsia sp. Marseille-P6047]|uniref:LacI family DNA-binding transcriptional regulator n=1 Tax=Romboutsia sp. Marseille-P6047 TaxID=2161817 RepID=UPI000F06D2CF|nr:LacI family DNA-binding transcriptional regulator [Romboutsia sp. Marseille-P6047]